MKNSCYEENIPSRFCSQTYGKVLDKISQKLISYLS